MKERKVKSKKAKGRQFLLLPFGFCLFFHCARGG
jgi:hypothetical protein